jgi:hypothetical protein
MPLRFIVAELWRLVHAAVGQSRDSAACNQSSCEQGDPQETAGRRSVFDLRRRRHCWKRCHARFDNISLRLGCLQSATSVGHRIDGPACGGDKRLQKKKRMFYDFCEVNFSRFKNNLMGFRFTFFHATTATTATRSNLLRSLHAHNLFLRMISRVMKRERPSTDPGAIEL